MKPALIHVDEKKIIGVEVRTTNAAEGDPKTGKIGPLWQKYYQEAGKIPNKKNADITYGTYTKYESDHNGPYTLIVASEVSNFDSVPEGMVKATIPAAQYVVFTAKGQMPMALIETWGYVLNYFSEKSEHQRAYTTDFELWDKNDPTKVDIYIAVK